MRMEVISAGHCEGGRKKRGGRGGWVRLGGLEGGSGEGDGKARSKSGGWILAAGGRAIGGDHAPRAAGRSRLPGVSRSRVMRSTPSLSVCRLETRRAASCICSAAGEGWVRRAVSVLAAANSRMRARGGEAWRTIGRGTIDEGAAGGVPGTVRDDAADERRRARPPPRPRWGARPSIGAWRAAFRAHFQSRTVSSAVAVALRAGGVEPNIPPVPWC